MPEPPEDELPRRQKPSPGVHINLGQSSLVLLTVTTENRDPWLANHTVHRLLHETWLEAKAWLVGDYLLMPDHLHCFCAPHDLHFTIQENPVRKGLCQRIEDWPFKGKVFDLVWTGK